MSYVIPTNELTLTDMKAFRGGAIEAGVQRALALGIARVREELVARDAFPRADFGTAATGWVTEHYLSMVIPAINAWCSAFTLVLPGSAHQLGRAQVAVFYKFADSEAQPVVNAVRFREGATGASTKASFFLQLETQVKLEPDVYFSEPVVYDPDDWLFIEIYPTGNLGGQENIPFGALIIERTGGTVS